MITGIGLLICFAVANMTDASKPRTTEETHNGKAGIAQSGEGVRPAASTTVVQSTTPTPSQNEIKVMPTPS